MSTFFAQLDKYDEGSVSHIEVDVDIAVPLGELTKQLNFFIDEIDENHVNTLMMNIFSKETVFERLDYSAITSQDVNRWERSVRRLERMPVIIIGMFRGGLGGPALDLLSVSDYRFATHDFEVTFPTSVGVICPGMFLYRFTKQLGQTQVRRLIFKSNPLKVEQAINLGMIDEISYLNPEEKIRISKKFEGISGRDVSIRRMLINEASANSFEDVRGTYLAAYERILR